MALSMDEQRILDEMASRLAEEDPELASRLASLGRPGVGGVLRSSRSRLLAAFLALTLIVVVSLMVYAMIPFRAAITRHPAERPAPAPSLTRPVTHSGAARAAAPAA